MKDDIMASEITPEQALKMLKSGEAVLLDVRTMPEYEQEHVEGSKWIPLNELESRIGELDRKKAIILCFCRSGARSAYACNMLEEKGFSKLYNVSGGIIDWKLSGLKTISGR